MDALVAVGVWKKIWIHARHTALALVFGALLNQ